MTDPKSFHPHNFPRGGHGWRRFHHRSDHRRALRIRRKFWRGHPLESRTFCPCEGCRLRFNRMLYPRGSSPFGEPLGYGRIKGFAGNFVHD